MKNSGISNSGNKEEEPEEENSLQTKKQNIPSPNNESKETTSGQ